MALCRPLLLYAPLHRFPVSNPTFFFPEYPCYSCKFTNRRNPQTPFCRTCCSSSSMEAPPQGYRRNVGICLINSSKKVFIICCFPSRFRFFLGLILDSEFIHLTFFLLLICRFFLHRGWIFQMLGKCHRFLLAMFLFL